MFSQLLGIFFSMNWCVTIRNDPKWHFCFLASDFIKRNKNEIWISLFVDGVTMYLAETVWNRVKTRVCKKLENLKLDSLGNFKTNRVLDSKILKLQNLNSTRLASIFEFYHNSSIFEENSNYFDLWLA